MSSIINNYVSTGERVWFPRCCNGRIEKITDSEIKSLGFGHQTRPMVTRVFYRCFDCKKKIDMVLDEQQIDALEFLLDEQQGCGEDNES